MSKLFFQQTDRVFIQILSADVIENFSFFFYGADWGTTAEKEKPNPLFLKSQNDIIPELIFQHQQKESLKKGDWEQAYTRMLLIQNGGCFSNRIQSNPQSKKF